MNLEACCNSVDLVREKLKMMPGPTIEKARNEEFQADFNWAEKVHKNSDLPLA